MNTTFDHRSSIPVSFGNMSRINPFNQKKNSNAVNKISNKRKCLIPNSTREFGKEINFSSNLTTYTNQETYNARKSFGIPVDKKFHKKISQQVNIKKKRKEVSNSLNKKPSNSNRKYSMNKNSQDKILKEQPSRIQNKNRSQKNILNSSHTISINDDIIMKDENINPNIITSKVYSSISLRHISSQEPCFFSFPDSKPF